MDAEKSLFTEQSYEDRHFVGLTCQDAELTGIEFFQCRFDGCQFLRTTFRVSGRRKPAIYERLKTSHPEKEGVCQVGSPVLNSGGILHGEPAHDGGYSSDLKFA